MADREVEYMVVERRPKGASHWGITDAARQPDAEMVYHFANAIRGPMTEDEAHEYLEWLVGSRMDDIRAKAEAEEAQGASASTNAYRIMRESEELTSYRIVKREVDPWKPVTEWRGSSGS